jgi:hypothetical protein
MEQLAALKYRSAYYGCRPQHNNYDDFTLRHPRMKLGQRAKIFSPFAALRGFDEAIEAKDIIYVEKKDLNEEDQDKIAQALSKLYEMTRNLRLAKANCVSATVTYYVPCMDENHEAYGCRGSYEQYTGTVWRVDPLLTKALYIGEMIIEFSEISDITILEGL